MNTQRGGNKMGLKFIPHIAINIIIIPELPQKCAVLFAAKEIYTDVCPEIVGNIILYLWIYKIILICWAIECK